MSTAPHDDVRGRWLFSPNVWRGSPTPAGARGVAAIELTVVIAVTLVMAALAVSAYRTYTARQEVRGSLAAVTAVRQLVTDAFNRTGVPPESERDLSDLPAAKERHPFLEAVTIKHGAIEMLFGNDAETSLRGRSVHITPFETMDGEVVWICGLRPPDVGLYPLGFSSGTNVEAQAAGTTVEPRYLPAECR